MIVCISDQLEENKLLNSKKKYFVHHFNRQFKLFVTMDVLCESGFCRLCADIKDSFLRIYDEEGYKLAIGIKINKYLQIQVDEKDSLPKNVCWECYSKLEQYSDFVTNCQNAQITLSQKVYSVYSEDNSLKEEGMFPNDSLFHQSSDLMNFGDQRVEKTGTVSTAFQYGNLNLSDSNPDCFFDKPADCLFEERNRNITDISRTTNDISPNTDVADCNGTADALKKKSLRKKNFSEAPVSMDNVAMSRCKRRAPRRKKTLSSKKIGVSGILSADEEYDEIDSISLKEKYFNNFPWQCADCEDNFQTVKELQYHHENYHAQSLRFICPRCYKLYMNYSSFVMHLERNLCTSDFVCDQCSKIFASKKLLENHLVDTHSEMRQYHCKDCGKSFKHQTAMAAHTRCHCAHNMKTEYACDQCDKTFSTKPNLVTHKKIHIGLRNYICDLCGKAFVQKGNLCAHMLTHSNSKPFTCETCNKEFKTLMQLRKHKNVHSGKKPHQCDTCGRMFRERGTLKEHYRIHTGVMPFSCEYCGKAFRFKGVLTTHRRQHTGERPYSCVECQHNFTNWPNYNKHMKRRHGIDKSRANSLKTDSVLQNQKDRTCEETIENSCGPSMELPAFEDALSPARLDANKGVRLFEESSQTTQLSPYLISHETYVSPTQEQNTLLNAFYNLSALQMLSSGSQVVDIIDSNVH